MRLACAATRRWVFVFLAGYILGGIWNNLSAAEVSNQNVHSGGRPVLVEQRGETVEWGRNPFSYPREGKEEDPGGSLGLKLTAIFYHEEGSMAIISHRIVSRGDRIGGKRVIKILKNRVVLRNRSGLYELTLDSFSLRPSEKERQ